MIEDNARTPIGISESENINLKMETYTIIGNADAIYNQGYSAGFAKGEEKGFEQGYKDGHADGYDKGFDAGEQKGVEAGKAEGLEEGYNKGYVDGLAQRTYEIWTMTLSDGTTVHKEVALL